MHRSTTAVMTLCAAFTLGACAGDRPALPQCGSEVPAGATYGVTIEAAWDKRSDPPTGGLTITLLDAATGAAIEPIPPEAAAFVECIREAVGV